MFYLLFSKVLVAKIVPPADVHPELFKGANRPFKVVDRVASLRKLHNKARTPEQAEKREKRLIEQEKRKRKRLAEAGIDYEFGGFEAAKLIVDPSFGQPLALALLLLDQPLLALLRLLGRARFIVQLAQGRDAVHHLERPVGAFEELGVDVGRRHYFGDEHLAEEQVEHVARTLKEAL